MKTLKYIIVTVLVVGLQSCDDYVDITPRGNAIAESLEDINLLLNNGSHLSGNIINYIPALINDNIAMRSQDISSLESSTFSRFYTRIYNLESVFYTPAENDELWRETYGKIGSMNYVLQLLENLEDSEEKRWYTGEALTKRAFYYFYLVNVYAQHYGLPIASENGSGIPIVTVFGEESVSLERKSVDEVYDFILKDLEKAIPLLGDRRLSADRINKTAAYALLANINLHMGKYSEALAHADMALEGNSTLLDYNTFPADFFGNITPPINLSNTEHVLLMESNIPVGFTTNFNNVVFGRFSPELTALYDPINDLRLKVPGIDFIDGSLVYGLFNNFQLRHAVGVTVPELLLIRAEALARTGNFSDAMSSINELREMRFATAFVATNGHLLAATNEEEAIAHILDERRREFHVNGKRFFDIKRLNAIENEGISLVRGNVTYSANGVNWAVPIGPNVINTSNGQIKQNPRE